MESQKNTSLEEKVAALEKKMEERDAFLTFTANLNARLAGTFLGLRPFSECEKGCLKIEDTQARLNCMLKCIADGK